MAMTNSLRDLCSCGLVFVNCDRVLHLDGAGAADSRPAATSQQQSVEVGLALGCEPKGHEQ